jgi:hypothetical protein
VGRTGFGKRHEPISIAGELRSLAVLDGERAIGGLGASALSTAFPITCAEEITAADPVVEALSEACAAWLARPDAKRLRSALLGILAQLD